MSDYSELERLADAAKNWGGEVGEDRWYTAECFKQPYFSVPDAEFIAACDPGNIRALIADLDEARNGMKYSCAIRLKKQIEHLEGERDKIRAEVAGLKTGYEAYERVNAELKAECEALRKDKDRLDALESNFWDVRHDSHPIADTGDSSSSLEIVGHWMDKPFERVIGEDWNENLRAAIDQAMKAPAYPPARPEYPEIDDIPDFTPGNGNSARRRAASLGIDYDAAMGKGDRP